MIVGPYKWSVVIDLFIPMPLSTTYRKSRRRPITTDHKLLKWLIPTYKDTLNMGCGIVGVACYRADSLP